jgi:hypothetical protein
MRHKDSTHPSPKMRHKDSNQPSQNEAQRKRASIDQMRHEETIGKSSYQSKGDTKQQSKQLSTKIRHKARKWKQPSIKRRHNARKQRTQPSIKRRHKASKQRTQLWTEQTVAPPNHCTRQRAHIAHRAADKVTLSTWRRGLTGREGAATELDLLRTPSFVGCRQPWPLEVNRRSCSARHRLQLHRRPGSVEVASRRGACVCTL